MPIQKGRVIEANNPDKSSANKDEYVGVDPVYQNAANKTEKPLKAQDKQQDEKRGEGGAPRPPQPPQQTKA